MEKRFWLLVGLLFFATVLGSIEGPWYFELFTHFKVQYGALFLLIALITLVFSFYRITLVAFLFGALQLSGIPDYYFPAPTYGDSTDSNLQITVLNLFEAHSNPKNVIPYLKASDSDVLILIETTQNWTELLSSELLKSYPNTLTEMREGHFGMAVWSRKSWKSANWIQEGEHDLPIAKITFKDGLELVAVHPPPPMGPLLTKARKLYYAELRQILAQKNPLRVVAGDFNAIPTSKVSEDLRDTGGLRDAALGFGYRSTWYSGIPFLNLTLDQVWITDSISVSSFEVGPDIGSDHRGLQVSVRYSQVN